MLALLDICKAIVFGDTIYPKQYKRKVSGIDIRTHNHDAIETHPMLSRIQIIQGSSIAPEIIAHVKEVIKDYKRILVSSTPTTPMITF